MKQHVAGKQAAKQEPMTYIAFNVKSGLFDAVFRARGSFLFYKITGWEQKQE